MHNPFNNRTSLSTMIADIFLTPLLSHCCPAHKILFLLLHRVRTPCSQNCQYNYAHIDSLFHSQVFSSVSLVRFEWTKVQVNRLSPESYSAHYQWPYNWHCFSPSLPSRLHIVLK